MESGGGQRRPAGLGPAIFGWPFAPTGRGTRPSCLVGWRQDRCRFTHRPGRGCPGFAVSAAPRIGRLVCCSNRAAKGLFLVGAHHPGATDVYMQSDEGPDLSRHGLVRSPNLASPITPHWMSPEAVFSTSRCMASCKEETRQPAPDMDDKNSRKRWRKENGWWCRLLSLSN
ncbi:hypothetical protein D3C80_1304070 [compost metagenome]